MAQESDSGEEDSEEDVGEDGSRNDEIGSDSIGQPSNRKKPSTAAIEDSEDDKDSSADEEEDNNNRDINSKNEESNRLSAQRKANSKAIASIKARYTASPTKPQTRSTSGSKARLDLALQGFSGPSSTKKGKAGGSASVSHKGKGKEVKRQATSESSKVVPRKPSGPIPSATRPLGVMYLITDATSYIMKEETNGVPAGFSRMTCKQFRRETLASNGLKVMSHQCSLETNKNWSMDKFNDFVLGIWPPIWAWVEAHLPKSHRGYMWTLMIPTLQELHQSQCSEAMLDMHYIWGIAYKPGKAFREGEIWLATVINVPEHVVKELLGIVGPPTQLIPTDATDSEDEASDRDVALDPQPSSKSKSSKIRTKSNYPGKLSSPKKVKQENHTLLSAHPSVSVLPKREQERTPSVSEFPEPKRRKGKPETPTRTVKPATQQPSRVPSIIDLSSSSPEPAPPASPSAPASPSPPASLSSPPGSPSPPRSLSAFDDNPWIAAPDANVWLNF